MKTALSRAPRFSSYRICLYLDHGDELSSHLGFDAAVKEGWAELVRAVRKSARSELRDQGGRRPGSRRVETITSRRRARRSMDS